ncbi:MAG: transposase [Candidatus Brocadiae bacterium]|nr:transposase [Candidatus Brocadiia bacterium]
MPRAARIVLPGFAHHVTQRGNNRQDVFFAPENRRRYLALLKRQCDKYGLQVEGYCLMTNHVHLVVRPATEASLAKALGRTHFLYTRYVNRLHGRSGHLWQNRFYSCPVDDDHVLAVMRYVERNPVRSGSVARPWDFPWSSASAHIGKPDLTGLSDAANWAQRIAPEVWAQLLMGPDSEGELSNVRKSTRSGRPLVGDQTLSRLEIMLGRRLRARPRGRPPREK